MFITFEHSGHFMICDASLCNRPQLKCPSLSRSNQWNSQWCVMTNDASELCLGLAEGRLECERNWKIFYFSFERLLYLWLAWGELELFVFLLDQRAEWMSLGRCFSCQPEGCQRNKPTETPWSGWSSGVLLRSHVSWDCEIEFFT